MCVCVCVRLRVKEMENGSVAVINLKFAMFNNWQHFSKSIFLLFIWVWTFVCCYCYLIASVVRVHFERLLYMSIQAHNYLCARLFFPPVFFLSTKVVIWCTNVKRERQREEHFNKRIWMGIDPFFAITYNSFVWFFFLHSFLFFISVCCCLNHHLVWLFVCQHNKYTQQWKCLLFCHLCTAENVHLGSMEPVQNGMVRLFVST